MKAKSVARFCTAFIGALMLSAVLAFGIHRGEWEDGPVPVLPTPTPYAAVAPPIDGGVVRVTVPEGEDGSRVMYGQVIGVYCWPGKGECELSVQWSSR